MMRIAFDATAAPIQPVGAGRYILEMAQALSRLDAEMELVIIAQTAGAQRLNLGGSTRTKLLVQPDRSPIQRLLWEQVSLPGLLINEGVDLLHSPHYTLPVRLKAPSVVTIHDLSFFRYPHLHLSSKRLLFQNFISISSRRGAAIITVSESTRQELLQITRISPRKVHTIHEGVTPDFHPIRDAQLIQTVRKRYHLPETFMLFVGLIEPRKNLVDLLSAIHIASKQDNDFYFVIVGRTGWQVNQVFKTVEQLGLKSRVIFTGYIPQEDLPVLYNMSRFFIYPSQYEGFGLPILEAMACGTPVITTQVSSMPEITGEAAMLIPLGDVETLALSIKRLWHDADLRQMMSKQGLQRAAGFSWNRAAQQTLDVYRYVLG
jgi:glycosyltransferase involved in cell wall biosynthesis